ncbi:MAG: hypothetical protein IPG63_07345 [Xanthomonadales bacterium]|nr:hypothetical protein [Xanthomonadales bacterium]
MNTKTLITLAITLGLCSSADADDIVWTGAVNSNWSQTANWTPNIMPTATDRAEFSPGATWRTVATPGSGYAIDDLYFPPGADAYSLDTSGGALNLGLGVLSESGGATRNTEVPSLALQPGAVFRFEVNADGTHNALSTGTTPNQLDGAQLEVLNDDVGSGHS